MISYGSHRLFRMKVLNGRILITSSQQRIMISYNCIPFRFQLSPILLLAFGKMYSVKWLLLSLSIIIFGRHVMYFSQCVISYIYDVYKFEF